MDKVVCLLFVLLMLLVFSISSASRAEVLLAADFDDKTLFEPLGTGGAVVGEPVSIQAQNLTKIVGTPADRTLYVVRNYTSNSWPSIVWNFLGDREVNAGTLYIRYRFTPKDLAGFFIRTRESGGSTTRWIDLAFHPSGNIWIDVRGDARLIGSYVQNVPLDVELVGNFDALTYQLHINGALIDSGSFDAMPLGVGRLLFGTSNLPGNDQKAYELDNLLVEWDETMFSDSFEG